MAIGSKDKTILPEKHTGYMLDGKEVTLTKKRGKPVKVRNPLFVPLDKKIEACSLYTVLGNVQQVAELTKLSEKQIREFKEEPWWGEIQRKMVVEQNEGLLAKINTTIEQALAMLQDRILNGDAIKLVDSVNEQGEVVRTYTRTPIKARDLAQIFHALSHQRQLMRGDPTQISVSTTTDDRLKLLQEKFKEFTNSTVESTLTVIEDKNETDPRCS